MVRYTSWFHHDQVRVDYFKVLQCRTGRYLEREQSEFIIHLLHLCYNNFSEKKHTGNTERSRPGI